MFIFNYISKPFFSCEFCSSFQRTCCEIRLRFFCNNTKLVCLPIVCTKVLGRPSWIPMGTTGFRWQAAHTISMGDLKTKVGHYILFRSAKPKIQKKTKIVIFNQTQRKKKIISQRWKHLPKFNLNNFWSIIMYLSKRQKKNTENWAIFFVFLCATKEQKKPGNQQ